MVSIIRCTLINCRVRSAIKIRPKRYCFNRWCQQTTGVGIISFGSHKRNIIHGAIILWQLRAKSLIRSWYFLSISRRFPPFVEHRSLLPIPGAARSKAWVCDRSHAGIAGSNPARKHGYLSLVSVVCCKLQVSATGRSLHLRSRNLWPGATITLYTYNE
jgi:hypothetical protein